MTDTLTDLTLAGTCSLASGAKFSRIVCGTGTPGYATSAGTCYVTGVFEVDGDAYFDANQYLIAGCVSYLGDNNAAAWSVQESTNVYQRFITTNAGEKVQFHKDVDLGLSGTAGKLTIFPSTAAKGYVTLQAADASGDTETTVNVAAQSGAVTYTIPDNEGAADFFLASWNVAADGMFKDPEADTEAGYLEFTRGGVTFQVPGYASS